jgi:hypothetical protein
MERPVSLVSLRPTVLVPLSEDANRLCRCFVDRAPERAERILKVCPARGPSLGHALDEFSDSRFPEDAAAAGIAVEARPFVRIVVIGEVNPAEGAPAEWRMAFEFIAQLQSKVTDLERVAILLDRNEPTLTGEIQGSLSVIPVVPWYIGSRLSNNYVLRDLEEYDRVVLRLLRALCLMQRPAGPDRLIWAEVPQRAGEVQVLCVLKEDPEKRVSEWAKENRTLAVRYAMEEGRSDQADGPAELRAAARNVLNRFRRARASEGEVLEALLGSVGLGGWPVGRVLAWGEDAISGVLAELASTRAALERPREMVGEARRSGCLATLARGLQRPSAVRDPGGRPIMNGLWIISLILIITWAFVAFVFPVGGNLIHILLVIVLLLVILKLAYERWTASVAEGEPESPDLGSVEPLELRLKEVKKTLAAICDQANNVGSDPTVPVDRIAPARRVLERQIRDYLRGARFLRSSVSLDPETLLSLMEQALKRESESRPGDVLAPRIGAGDPAIYLYTANAAGRRDLEPRCVVATADLFVGAVVCGFLPGTGLTVVGVSHPVSVEELS